MGTWTLVIDILKTGFFLAVAFWILYLIYWAMKRNIQWLFGGSRKNKELVAWLVVGLKKGYDDKDLKIILLDKNYKPEKIIKALKEAYKIVIKEVEGENAKEGRGLRSPEEEIKNFKEQE